ncbi:hypothetical protein [uncultured Kriegella sp.]|uniref:hypothetical protein n=1 Tax=uncultured Kriegella sp. TaxID=1798910 RepID=UPI0030D7CA3E|tara:strand:- start:104196 stop:105038 length:843 start_codon:yes stop_codon:yes gene_type:complete
MNTKKIVLVSGCMAVQDRAKKNIVQDDVYHWRMKKEIFVAYGINIDFPIITYRDLIDCFPKVKEFCGLNAVDLMVFQVRSHDYLSNTSYKKKAPKVADDGDITPVNKKGRQNLYQKLFGWYRKIKLHLKSKETGFYKVLLRSLRLISRNLIRPLLLVLGMTKNNHKKVERKYENLLVDIDEYCAKEGIPVVYLGVTSRPNSYIENLICKRLNTRMSQFITSMGGTYIDIFGKYDDESNYKFVRGTDVPDQICLNAVGHKEVANKLMVEVKEIALPLEQLA